MTFESVAMPETEPKWRRRKDERPAEIVDAALEVFAEKGFASAKLDDIARRAGISKATLYLYFETKEEIFRAVARTAVASLLEALESPAEGPNSSFNELAPRLLSRAASMISSDRVPADAAVLLASLTPEPLASGTAFVSSSRKSGTPSVRSMISSWAPGIP